MDLWCELNICNMVIQIFMWILKSVCCFSLLFVPFLTCLARNKLSLKIIYLHTYRVYLVGVQKLPSS